MKTSKKLTALAREALAAEIARIKSAPANSSVAQANEQIRSGKIADTGGWVGAGSLTMVGIGFYGITCELVITGSSTSLVMFDANGFSWAAIAGECEIVGSFVVDPASVRGKCNFTLAIGAIGEGAVAFTLYSTGGSLYGVFAGDVEGGGAAYVSGDGTLKVS